MFARKHPKRFLLNVDCFLMFAIKSSATKKNELLFEYARASTMHVE